MALHRSPPVSLSKISIKRKKKRKKEITLPPPPPL
uniref:Uncharacterized protein n=1 Tax=Nelumbo nucifera TaxID=4432 RepID=A0A822ZAH3_NELNU|nr:TPA_asm: hypothetical protein HUJ06_015863 [Nelumbo nucifera]